MTFPFSPRSVGFFSSAHIPSFLQVRHSASRNLPKPDDRQGSLVEPGIFTPFFFKSGKSSTPILVEPMLVALFWGEPIQTFTKFLFQPWNFTEIPQSAWFFRWFGRELRNPNWKQKSFLDFSNFKKTLDFWEMFFDNLDRDGGHWTQINPCLYTSIYTISHGLYNMDTVYKYNCMI